MCVPKTSDHIQINIGMPNPSQEPPASSKAPNQALKDMDVVCTFKIKIEDYNSDHACIKDQCPYQNQDKGATPKSGTSSLLWISKSGLEGHCFPLHIQNQYREPKFGSLFYQRPVTLSKSISWCQNPVRNPQCPQKCQIRTLRIWVFFAPLNQHRFPKFGSRVYQRPVTIFKSR